MVKRLIGRRTALATGAALATRPLIGRAAWAQGASPQAAGPLRIGVLTDETGPYADASGPGSVLAAQMAVAEFGGTVLGRKIEVLHADTQNKSDIASGIARQWYDRDQVELITDLPVTPVAAAVLQLAKEKSRSVIITASATSDFTAKLCTPISVHWADDTNALTVATAAQVVKSGGKTWFFITVDFTFGAALQRDASSIIESNGGKVIGSVRYPLGNTDYSSQVVEAQASGAQAIGLASVGNDLVNVIKQAAEFGIVKAGQRLVGFLVYITDIHALGLLAAQGLTFSAGFYWDQGEEARKFGARFFKERGVMPTKNHAAIYASTLHYLKAMAQAGTPDAVAVNRAMRAIKVDYLGRPASVRADGRVIYDLTLYRVKAPEQSKAPWDYYEALATIPGERTFLPMNPSCAA